MEHSTSASTYTNASKVIFAMLIFISGESCMVSKSRVQEYNILERYYDKQNYTKDKSGNFIQEAEQMVVNKLSRDFKDVNSIVVIKEFCKPFNFAGYIYSQDDQKGTYFSRAGELAPLNYNPSYAIAPIFYDRIISLLQKDSLVYYNKADEKELAADDEFCWLYVIHSSKSGNTYSEKRYVFYKPLALRGAIINY